MRTLRTRVRLLIVLGRPPVLFLLALYATIGMAEAGQSENRLLLARILLPVAAYLLYSIACNDLADEDIDRINLPGDPSRPLVSGGALRREMKAVAAVAAIVTFGGGLLLGLWPTVIVTAGLCISTAYSLRPIRLADRGAIAALVLPACLVAVPFLLGRLATGPRLTVRDLLLLLGLYVGFIGRILLKDFRDVRGDTLFGKRTYLVRHGRDRTCRFSAACWILGVILLTVCAPHPSVAFVIAVPIQLTAALWLLNRLRTETHPRREAALISAIAIVGRGIMLTLLAHLATTQAHWPVPAQSATLGAVLALTLGQASTMTRLGPTTRRLPVPRQETMPTAERIKAL